MIDESTPSPELFSVYWWDPEGNYHCERVYVPIDEALIFANEFVRRPASKLGIIRRLIITDALDRCVYEWKHGLGITFPPKPDEPSPERS